MFHVYILEMEHQQAKTSAGNHSQSAASGSTSSPENKSSQMGTIPSPNPTPSSTGDAGPYDPKQLRRSISLLFIYIFVVTCTYVRTFVI